MLPGTVESVGEEAYIRSNYHQRNTTPFTLREYLVQSEKL